MHWVDAMWLLDSLFVLTSNAPNKVTSEYILIYVIYVSGVGIVGFYQSKNVSFCVIPYFTHFSGVYILIGAGSLIMLVGFFGCCGAVKESQCLLGSVSTISQLVLVMSS